MIERQLAALATQTLNRIDFEQQRPSPRPACSESASTIQASRHPLGSVRPIAASGMLSRLGRRADGPPRSSGLA